MRPAPLPNGQHVVGNIPVQDGWNAQDPVEMEVQDGGRSAGGGHDICGVLDSRQLDVALPTVHPDGRLVQLHERRFGYVVQDLQHVPSCRSRMALRAFQTAFGERVNP